MTRATTYAIRIEGTPGSPPSKPWRTYTGVCGIGELPCWFSSEIDVPLHVRYDHREDASVFREADLRHWLQELPPFAPPTTLLDFALMVDEELDETMRVRLFVEHLLRELAWASSSRAVALVRRE